ncbi:ABC transporter permease [Herbihabitans rhizosphaerae]|nr:ABC transporter permease [Herbihabitans rhizosphaerae]
MSRHALPARHDPRSYDPEATVTLYLRHNGYQPPQRQGPQWTGTRLSTQVAVLAGRSLRAAFSDYRLVFFGLLQPIVLLLLFSQVFSALGTLPGVAEYQSYLNFLMPATMVNIALATAMSSGVGLLAEVYTGFVGRLRAMPVNLLAVLMARTVSDAVRLAVQLAVAVLAAVYLLDFQPPNAMGTIAAMLLCVVFGWGLSWIFVALATWQHKPEIMHAASFVVMFPLMFSSSAYMPVNSMPGWLQAVSKANPVTYAIDATRALALGKPVGSALAMAVLLIAGAALLGGAISARNFRRTR